MRTYEQTHPWIKFAPFDTHHIDYETWMLLGQAQAKCEQIAGAPLLPDVQQDLHQVFLAKGVLATTAIEGNTLTEEQVRQLLEGKLKLPPSQAYMEQEIDNIVQACNSIGKGIVQQSQDTELCIEDIKLYNTMVLKNLPLNEEVIPGELRSYPVSVAGYRAAPPEDLSYLLARFCEWINDIKGPEHYKIAFDILKAIIAHVYLAWIHPFGDGNGRTARLVEFQILLAAGVPTPAAHLLSNHYNKTRSEYYRHLMLTSKHDDGIFAFIKYAVQGFVDGLNEQIQLIEAQQLIVHWRDYIYRRFDREKDTESNRRKRRLLLDLSKETEPAPLAEIRHISTRIAEAYATLTDKTVERDIRQLVSMRLVRRTPRGFRANTESVLAFLPPRRVEG
ncbi:MAG: Fic family protein [Anaerolineae bacterium]|nr:Fic family protein [Anaerolineae bacterium]